MDAENTSERTGAVQEAPAKRERSQIAFPYGDLDDAVLVAQTIRESFGSASGPDQLAAQMGMDESNGTFRVRIATARIFGVTEVTRRLITLTDLGAQLADETQESAARAEAFLRVPLYRALFENHRGRQLPGDEGLEREIVRLGVSSKQAARARRAFQRSAEQAGFFRSGRDRLVRPATLSTVAPVETVSATEPESQPVRPERSEAVELAGLHPLLEGLIRTIPREGESFPPKRQRQWLEAAKVNFALIFGSDEDDGGEGSQDSGSPVRT